MPAKPASIVASSATYEALISTSPACAELSSVIFSTPTTSTKRALPAASVFRPMWIAADPVAQAFSTRVLGLKRRSGWACRASDEWNSWRTKPPFMLPT